MRVGGLFQGKDGLAVTLHRALEKGFDHFLDGDKAAQGDDVGDVGVQGGDVHRRKRAPAMTHDRERAVFVPFIRLDGADAIIEVAQGLCKAAGRRAPRWDADRDAAERGTDRCGWG